MYELFQHRNFWFDIDRNGTPVAHLARTKTGWGVYEKDTYQGLAEGFKTNKEALKWYEANYPEQKPYRYL
jgi:hypothetical protein